jgi:hypothetical protein
MSPFRSLQRPAGIARASVTALRGAALGLGAFGLIAVGAGASAENGLLDDYEYESPTYGYTVEWDDPWAATEQDAESEDGIDSLFLNTRDSQVMVLSLPTDYNEEELVELFSEGLADDGDEVEILEQGEAGGNAYAIAELTLESGGTMIAYYEAEEIVEPDGREPAIVVVTGLLADEADFDESLESANETIELEGDPLFRTLGAETDEDEDADEDAEEDEDERGGRSDDEDEEDEDAGRDDEDEDDEEDDEDEEDEDEDEDEEEDEEEDEDDERA